MEKLDSLDRHWDIQTRGAGVNREREKETEDDFQVLSLDSREEERVSTCSDKYTYLWQLKMTTWVPQSIRKTFQANIQFSLSHQ